MNYTELHALRDRLDQPLRHDFDVLETIERDGQSQTGLEQALATRKKLRSDTLAPNWLRDYAEEVVAATREP